LQLDLRCLTAQADAVNNLLLSGDGASRIRTPDPGKDRMITPSGGSGLAGAVEQNASTHDRHHGTAYPCLSQRRHSGITWPC